MTKEKYKDETYGTLIYQEKVFRDTLKVETSVVFQVQAKVFRIEVRNWTFSADSQTHRWQLVEEAFDGGNRSTGFQEK